MSSAAAAPPPDALARAKRYNEKLKRKIAELKALQAKEAEAKARAEAKAKKEAERDAARAAKAPADRKEVKAGAAAAEPAAAAPALPSRAEVKEAFNLFDTDKSSFIEWNEFQLLTAQLGHALSEREVKEAIASFDKDGDGKVSFDEFYAWYTDPKTAGATGTTAAGAATAALIQAKLLLFKGEAMLKRLAAAKPLEIKESKGGDIHHSVSWSVGSFGAPAAAVTWSLEFKHAAEEAFVRSQMCNDPIAFVSVDLKMVSGKATADEHKQFFSRLLFPLLELPELPRELRALKLNVENIGRDLVRLTVMIPNPDTYRALEERRSERARYQRALAQKALKGESTLPEQPPASDDDILAESKNPFDIIAKFGIDFEKLVKKAQIRLELAQNLETVQTPGVLKLADILKARFAAEAIIDPAIIKAVIDGAKTALGDEINDRKLAKMMNAFFGSFVKVSQFAVSFGDLSQVIENFGAAMFGKADDEANEAQIQERAEGGRGPGKQGTAYLVKGDIRRLLKMYINSQSARSEYRYRDHTAMLTAFKMFTTIVSKDIEEVTGVHVRAKTGLGASLRLDRVLLFPAMADIAQAIRIEVPDEVRRSARRY